MRRAAVAGARITLALVMLAAGGCANTGAEAHPKNAGVSAPPPTRGPAGDVGGACYLLDYDVVEQAVGVSFDVAAAGEAKGTYTCVLQTEGGSYPDLTLAVTTTAADPAVFKATVPPKASAPVAELGQAGYTMAVPAGSGAGPGVEVGWLSGNGRILVLRFRLPPSATVAEAGALAPKLVALAKKVDSATV